MQCRTCGALLMNGRSASTRALLESEAARRKVCACRIPSCQRGAGWWVRTMCFVGRGWSDMNGVENILGQGEFGSSAEGCGWMGSGQCFIVKAYARGDS